MASIIIAVFATLLTLAWAPDVNVQLSLMIFYRFAIGTGIGADILLEVYLLFRTLSSRYCWIDYVWIYSQLSGIIPLFAVVYGLFLSFGEAGPGNCLGLLATKSFPTAVRGQLYAACAIIGKLGALAGTWAFPLIIASFPGSNQAAGPFYVGSGLALFSAIIVYFLVSEINEDSLAPEDAAFREYLELHGYDTSVMGLHRPADLENIPTLAITDSTEKDVEMTDEK